MKQRTVFSGLVVVLCLLVLAACGGGDDKASSSDEKADGGGASTTSTAADTDKLDAEAEKRDGAYDAPPTLKLDPAKTYPVVLTTDKGEFTINVEPKLAPIAAANFVFLAGEGFYDGTKFHRVIRDFMIQGGDPLGTGTGGPGYNLKDDPVKGTYSRGTVAMANAGPNTGGSQFFIVHGDNVQLPPDYVIFGSVDEAGMKVVDKIAEVDVEAGSSGEQSSPVTPVYITSAKVKDSSAK
jgi:peptidylprolyl isomerase